MNQIVVQYEETNLTLLQVRSSDGKYTSYTELEYLSNKHGVKLCSDVRVNNLDDLLKLKSSEIGDMEGWIIVFDDGTIAKVKTDSYVDKHGIFTGLNENTIIHHTINGNIDDVSSKLTYGSTKRIKVETVVDFVRNNIDGALKEVVPLLNKYAYNRSPVDRKVVVEELRTLNTPWFSIIMKMYGTSVDDGIEEIESMIKDDILKRTKTIESAKKFLGV